MAGSRNTKRMVPAQVLAKAKELTRKSVAKLDAPPDTTTTRARGGATGNPARAKVIAALKRLHPMD